MSCIVNKSVFCLFVCQIYFNTLQNWGMLKKQTTLALAFEKSFYAAHHCEVCQGVTGKASWLQSTVKSSSMICFQGLLWVFCGRMIYRLTWLLLGLIRISQSIIIDSFATLWVRSCWYRFFLSKFVSHHCTFLSWLLSVILLAYVAKTKWERKILNQITYLIFLNAFQEIMKVKRPK